MEVKYLRPSSPLEGQRVLARFDFNVPLKNGEIVDTTRIDLALPTIKLLLELKISKLVLMSHFGRPKGQGYEEKYSLMPVALYLAKILSTDIVLSEKCVDSGVKAFQSLPEGKIILLENLRFDAGETKNEASFIDKLKQYGDIYVNDAFGACHREHASVFGLAAYFPKKAYGGLLLEKEVTALKNLLGRPKRPFVAVLGGAKIGDKISVIETLIARCDHILIGGAMAYPFLKAKGHSIGKSMCEEQDVALAQRLLSMDARSGKIQLPKDHLYSMGDTQGLSTAGEEVPENGVAFDIGPKTIDSYTKILQSGKTIFWNGPLGFFEKPAYAQGTISLANTINDLSTIATTYVGGGDSVAALQLLNKEIHISHVSTGGGASLEFLEKGNLPGIMALEQSS